MTDKERLIEFLRENITEDEIGSAWETIAEWRCPLSMADDALYHQIEDLVQEFADDNDLGEDFVDLMDIEELFEQL